MTKKRNFTAFMIAIMIMLFLLPANAQETKGYVHWYEPESEPFGTLTFYGGDMPSGTSLYELNTGKNNPGWLEHMSYCTKVVFDVSFKDVRPTSCYNWFNEFYQLTEIEGIENLNTSEVTDMESMFKGCSKLTSLDVSNFNTANVTDMNGMFQGCSGLTSLDVSNFNIANVTKMESMFQGCSSLKSLNLSNINTDNVMHMSFMFSGCSGLTSLDVSNFNTANVTKMGGMFQGCSGLNSIDLSNFNTDNVERMGDMFNGCSGLTSLDLSNFNTDKVRKMESMFQGCSKLTSLDVSKFNTAKVTRMYAMFQGCSGLTSLDVSKFNTDKVTDMGRMFMDCSGLTSLDVSNFNTANVTKMGSMFRGCSGLTSLDLSNFKTANVASMGNMFDNCSGLTSLDLSSFNTAKVRFMNEMFYGCSSLMTIYVSDYFTTSAVYNGSKMFTSCSKLKGAASYSDDKTDYSMANYTTGYFSYGIKTVEDWNNFADKVNNGYTTMCAGLLKDITDANVLTTIGSNGFTGTFDGFGHTISGLNFNSTFSALYAQNGGTIKNLGILAATIAEGASGNICQTNSGTIESCYFMGTTGSKSAGGICPTNNGTMTKCYYLADEDNGNGGKTEEQFISGEVCYLLSQGAESSVWGQQLGTDNNPVLSDYKVIKAAKDDYNTYWATFSNLNSDVTLSVPSARNLKVYNATVGNGTMTLTKRTDNQVAKGEGVLLKTDREYVNVKANAKDNLTKADYADNNLVATPATEQTIEADAEHKLYRLTYKNVSTKTGLGFYLGVVGDSKDGSQLKATPGKAYLEVAKDAATDQSTSKLALGFAFPDNDDETVTGISGVTVSDRIQTSDRIYDLQGRPVVNPTKGVYIRNGRKVVY